MLDHHVVEPSGGTDEDVDCVPMPIGEVCRNIGARCSYGKTGPDAEGCTDVTNHYVCQVFISLRALIEVSVTKHTFMSLSRLVDGSGHDDRTRPFVCGLMLHTETQNQLYNRNNAAMGYRISRPSRSALF